MLTAGQTSGTCAPLHCSARQKLKLLDCCAGFKFFLRDANYNGNYK